MESTSCHSSQSLNFEVALSVLENVCVPGYTSLKLGIAHKSLIELGSVRTTFAESPPVLIEYKAEWSPNIRLSGLQI